MAYTSAAGRGIEGLRIGVLTEALDPVGVTDDVRTAFEAAVKTLRGLGAEVTEVSAPLWEKGWAISLATMPAATSMMVKSNGTGGYAHLGRVDPQMVEIGRAHV